MTQSEMPAFPESYWHDSVKFPTFSKVEGTIKSEVVIVGAGITGITAAYHLSQQNVKVVVLEAGLIGNGTTGHTTAKITAQHGIIYDEFIQHFGLEGAAKYYKAQSEAKAYIKDTINKLHISCDYKEEDAYIYTNQDNYLSTLEKEKAAYDQLGIEGEMTNHISLQVPHKAALIMKNQAQFHPLKYLKALVEECTKNGVEFYENTTAMDMEYNTAPAVITRDGHRVYGKHIIAASHFPFYDKESFYFTRMYPERSYIIAMKAEDEYPGGMYITAESPTRSIRSATINGETIWIIGGDSHKTGQGKSTIKHYESLKAFADSHFRVKDYIYRWSAQDLTTMDKMPYIGAIKNTDASIMVATGFRKWGMTNGTIAGKILADKILGVKNDYASVFIPSRFHSDPDLKKFMEINADVAKHLLKGKLEFTDNSIEKLQPDEATITRIDGQRTGVYKDKHNKLFAVDTTCTHLGCEVEWNSGDRSWDCPCHGSRFSITGEVMEGPAKKPLKQRKV
ncbi:FAD-dependent oxidoreductase [Oceanobacillus piezotolerans]|uniref:FAD-dependent oxidoreductase n=1 Tax=Oceanobacillus piezotolerans TaxID=2448030 RepID=A0A498DGD8_9BACI|nr:FAD-dependent oxidoreductase [Oceanobacillus piezotolerans]RLL48258.1 FAD-dependent oxidoreductase [Oceanobacillus piezotolerans]